jgi:molecular chaperone DnaK (HSP70)
MIIGNWPRHVGSQSNDGIYKTPTQLATDGLDNNAGRPVRWGLLVSDDEPSFRWFKLGLVHQDEYLEDDLGELHDDIQNSDEFKKAVALRERHRASATSLTTAYLKALWNHVLKEVASRLKIPEDLVRQSELHVAIGTPANSKSGTVNILRRAAKNAGIPGHRHPRSKLYVCTEPEAAAIALVEHRQVSQDLTVRWSASLP